MANITNIIFITLHITKESLTLINKNTLNDLKRKNFWHTSYFKKDGNTVKPINIL